MNFENVSRVQDVITRMQDSDEPRAKNRARIDGLFNGDPPFTDDEAAAEHVQLNYALGSAPDIMSRARGQWENAFTGKDRYFSVRLDKGPAHKRITWSNEITRRLAKLMKRRAAYTSTLDSEGAQVMLHGIGPSMWENEDAWAPDPVALEDIKVPSRTLTDLTNLTCFAVMRRYTPNQLYRSAFGKFADKRWNKRLVKQILTKLADINVQQTDWDTYRFPERLEEDFKGNSGYWGSDAVPTVNCWNFFWQEDEDKGAKWQRRVLLDYDQPTLAQAEIGHEFLYTDKQAYADELGHILHVCFANGAHVAPFRWHSVRGLGYRLYGPEKVQQRIQIRFSESVLQEMLWIFSNVPAEDRERLELIFLHHMGVLPEGARWVPANERYRPDLNLILAGMNQNRQLMSESSSTYLQEVAGEQDRETATKTMARLSLANQLVNQFLNKAYEQQRHQYREICRRFCRPSSLDPDVKEFQRYMREESIPKEVLDVDCWDVQPERTIGNGSQLMGAAMVDRLMAVFPRFDPQAQREVLHLYTDVNTGDSALAEHLVPLKEVDPSPAVVRAAGNFGTLMEGVPVPMSRDINHIEYAQTLLALLGARVETILRDGSMPDDRTVKGLFNVGQEIGKHIQLLSQDPDQKELVKQLSDELGNLMNEIKGMAQRLVEAQQQAAQQPDPELVAKIQMDVLSAKTNLQIKQAQADQKMRLTEAKFAGDQRRKNMAALADLQRRGLSTTADVAQMDVTTAAQLKNDARLTDAQVENERKKAAAKPKPADAD